MSGIPAQPSADDRSARSDAVTELFGRLRATEPGSAEAAQLRAEIVERSLPLVRAIAARFRDRGEPFDDLVQAGSLGLLKAVDRFDPDRGAAFSTYAIPTVTGEIKRHFRDHTWAVRVPRRLQELRQALTARTPVLQQQLGRSPTLDELAADLDVTTDDVLEALEAGDAYSAIPLDAPAGGDADAPSAADRLGDLDLGLQRVEDREALRPLLAALPDRERRIIYLRFVENRTQSEIADDIGVSQMHVSRLLAATLAQMREAMTQRA